MFRFVKAEFYEGVVYREHIRAAVNDDFGNCVEYLLDFRQIDVCLYHDRDTQGFVFSAQHHRAFVKADIVQATFHDHQSQYGIDIDVLVFRYSDELVVPHVFDCESEPKGTFQLVSHIIPRCVATVVFLSGAAENCVFDF